MRPIVVVAVMTVTAAAGGTPRPVVDIQTKASRAYVESTLTIDRVMAKLERTYLAQIERCYRDRFGKKPRAIGDLEIEFGVEPDGKTSGIKVATFDAKLEGCITKRMKTWSFERPKDTTKMPMSTGFAFEFALVPTATPKETDLEAAARYATLLTEDTETSDMSERRPGAELGQQINPPPKYEWKGTGERGGGPRDVGTNVSTTPTTPPGPSGRVTVATKTGLDTTTLTPDVVLAKIQAAYMAGLHRCYRNALRANPELKGNLTIAFVVGDTGKTSSQTVTASDPALADCVKSMVASWRFPVPKKGDAATSARFELGVNVTPN